MDFLELQRDSRVTTGNSGCLLCWPREVQSSIRRKLANREDDRLMSPSNHLVRVRMPGSYTEPDGEK